MKLAYLINDYPKVSHSFIRREIRALERMGFDIQRISLRGWNNQLPDPDDQSEQRLTHYILRRGSLAVVGTALRVFLTRPLAFLRTVAAAIRLSRESRDRMLAYHLYYVLEACVVLQLIRQSGARHLHAHFGTNSAEIALLTRLLGGPPYSFTAHGPEEFLRPMGLPEKIRHAAFAVAISSYGRSQMYWHASHDAWPRIHVVHC